MNKLTTFAQKLIFPVLIFCGFCIALPPFFKILSIMLLALVLLASGELFRSKYTVKQILDFRNPLFWLSGLYIFYCIGMLWSSNTAYGLMDLQIKLPLILLPFLFCFVPKQHLDKKHLWIYAFAFIAGLIIVLCYCLIHGFIKAFSGEGFRSEYLFYTRLANEYHATYLSLFASVAILLSYKIPLTENFKFNQKQSAIIKAAFILFFDVFVILLSSRIAFIAMSLVHLIILSELLFSRTKYAKSAFFIIFSALVVIATFNVKNYKQRYDNIGDRLNIETDGKLKKYSDSISQRTFIYTNIHELLLRSPFIGYGTGDTRDVLENFYNERDVSFGRYLNAHNQFLQTTVAIGVLGLACLVAVFVCFALRLWNKNGYVLLSGIAIIALFMMTESVLERQAGVHFCSFAFCWFYAITCKDNKKED